VKGIVFNLLESVVTSEYGTQTWDELLTAAGTDGVYTSLGNYEDAELLALVAAASKALETPVDELVRWFGSNAIDLLAAQYPVFFEPHDSTRPFLLTLNDIIHAEVRKLYPDALVPTFAFATSSDGAFSLTYDSPRHLCSLAEGFVEGAARHYGETVSIEQPTCMKRGDDACVIVCTFGAQ
jgi:Haem-NO-binding